MRKFIKTICFALVLSLPVTGIGASQPANQNLKNLLTKPKKMNNQVGLLFIQQADRATISSLPTAKNTYQLILKKPKKKVLYFSNEPKRVSGSLDTSAFIKIIVNNKKHYQITPNIAIQGYMRKNGKRIEVNKIAVLTGSKYDPKRQTVTYNISPVEKDNLGSLKHLKNVTIFFDPFNPWPP